LGEKAAEKALEEVAVKVLEEGVEAAWFRDLSSWPLRALRMALKLHLLLLAPRMSAR
jgi:hypothetical protein